MTLRLGRDAGLALACAAGAAMLGASQFMDVFQLVPPGGEPIAAVSSADQHGYSMLVLAVLSLVLLVVSIGAERTPGETGARLWQFAAVGVAASGVVALLLFGAIDLPDVNSRGLIEDADGLLREAVAEPRAGFWLELAGALVLALAGIARAALPGDGRGRPAGEPPPAEDRAEAAGPGP